MHPHRREFSRVSTHMEAEVAVGETTIVSGDTHDVSMKGLSLECSERPPVGAACQVSLFLGGRASGVQVKASGRVARATDSGFAIEFTELSARSLEHLRNLVLHNAPHTDEVEQEFRNHLGLKRRK